MAEFPQEFGRYQLMDRIAAGGMAEVFRAKVYGVEGFEKSIAIKRILPAFSSDPAFVDMFVREARLTVQLTHSNIVQVFELGKIGDRYYIAMELVDGWDLRTVVRQSKDLRTPFLDDLSVYVVSESLSGLHHAHTVSDERGHVVGIIHRDVSPHNILISRTGQVKVGDFGIAKLTRHGETKEGDIRGKLHYMSPEQLKNGAGDVDTRADIYSLGVVLYELVTGILPFEMGEGGVDFESRLRQLETLSKPSSRVSRLGSDAGALAERRQVGLQAVVAGLA